MALESKDPYTAGHVERVATYADYIAEELGLRPAARRRVHAAALMHDIGKLAIPNQLLNKPDRLTAFEYERVRRHEEVTFEILRRIDLLRPISPSITARQPRVERAWPRTAIEPCVIAVADAYDAMTSTRAYRRALPREVAFRELRDNVGTQFDQRCVDALIQAGAPEPKYLFLSHSEVPHAGGIGRFLSRFPDAIACGDVADLHLVFPEYANRFVQLNPGDTLPLGGTDFVVVEGVFRDLATRPFGASFALLSKPIVSKKSAHGIAFANTRSDPGQVFGTCDGQIKA